MSLLLHLFASRLVSGSPPHLQINTGYKPDPDYYYNWLGVAGYEVGNFTCAEAAPHSPLCITPLLTGTAAPVLLLQH